MGVGIRETDSEYIGINLEMVTVVKWWRLEERSEGAPSVLLR